MTITEIILFITIMILSIIIGILISSLEKIKEKLPETSENQQKDPTIIITKVDKLPDDASFWHYSIDEIDELLENMKKNKIENNSKVLLYDGKIYEYYDYDNEF